MAGVLDLSVDLGSALSLAPARRGSAEEAGDASPSSAAASPSRFLFSVDLATEESREAQKREATRRQAEKQQQKEAYERRKQQQQRRRRHSDSGSAGEGGDAAAEDKSAGSGDSGGKKGRRRKSGRSKRKSKSDPRFWRARESHGGSVEYKRQLAAGTSPARFEQLVTQLKFRLREGQGQCTYFLGVDDGGFCGGLGDADLAESLATLTAMCEALTTETGKGASLGLVAADAREARAGDNSRSSAQHAAAFPKLGAWRSLGAAELAERVKEAFMLSSSPGVAEVAGGPETCIDGVDITPMGAGDNNGGGHGGGRPLYGMKLLCLPGFEGKCARVHIRLVEATHECTCVVVSPTLSLSLSSFYPTLTYSL